MPRLCEKVADSPFLTQIWWALFAVCLWLGCSERAHRAENEVAGFVLRKSGDWIFLDEHGQEQSVTSGMELHGGAIVRPAKGAENPELVLCLYNGKTSPTFTKEETVPYRKSGEKESRIFAALCGKYRGRVIEAASRGDEIVQNGVVLLQDGRADLAALFGELPEGEWTFQLKPFNADRSTQNDGEVRTFLATWGPGTTSSIVEFADLKPGLFDLLVVNPRTKRPVAEAAAVLFCDSQDYEKQAEIFQEGLQLTRAWNKEDRISSAHAFTRALVESLAKERSK